MTVGSIGALSLNEPDPKKVNFAVQQLLQRNSGQQINATVTTTVDYTLKSSDRSISATGGTTLTFPAASAAPGQIYWITKSDTSTAAVSLAATIDGSTSQTISKQFESRQFQSNSTTWNTVSKSAGAIFDPASPGPIGGTTPDAISARNLDVEEAGNVSFWPSTHYVPTLAKFIGGNNTSTGTNPTVGISRDEAISEVTTDGHNAALLVTSYSNNISTVSVGAMGTGICVYAQQAGTGDVVGTFYNIIQAGGQSTGYGAFTGYATFAGMDATTPQSGIIAMQTNMANNSGADYPLSGATFGNGLSVGIDMVAAGSYMSSAGYWTRTNGGAKFDAGYVALAGSINRYCLTDNSSSQTVIYSTGSHINGIDFSASTFSSKAIKTPGFSVSSTGAVICTLGTSDPGITGSLWISSGAVMIST